MIRLQLTQASAFQNSFLKKQFQLPIKKRHFIIGRGEQLQDKESKENEILNLNNFSNTLSRLHASIDFSPAWFLKDIEKVAQYLKQMKIFHGKIHSQLLQIIWSFIRPKKQCILRDLKSKFGTFKKLDDEQIKEGMIIQFVHQTFLTIQNYQQYENFEQLEERIQNLKKSKQNLIIFGDLKKIRKQYDQCKKNLQKRQYLKIWRVIFKEKTYLLLIENNLILKIGRSSHCEIQVKDTAISRYQAHLKCVDKKWRIIDGNQIQKSKNGTWKKCNKIKIDTSLDQVNTVKNLIKIGSIKCEIQVIQNFQWLNIVDLVKQDESMDTFIE